MTPNKTIIKEFFAGEKQYNIPLYQRAYSWEEKQLSQFLEDLKEASKGNNSYFLAMFWLKKWIIVSILILLMDSSELAPL